MVFTSPRFIVFLVIVLAGLTVLRSVKWKKRLLAVASCVFYAAWDWRYLGLLLLISVIDYVAADRISESSDAGRRRRWLLLSLGSNLGVLAYFKYCDFFIENMNVLLGRLGIQIPALHILLPVGISFYTFKTMSYTIDVYRKELEPCRRWMDYATFVTFFPELVAGPIVRASVFLPQMGRTIGLTWPRLIVGGSVFVQGLGKKLLVADRLAKISDPIFADPALYSPITIWIGVLAYGIQIYCDFSGYSDMAIGVAKMIGYDLPENFNMPYWSRNITEFWRRWHMTLSAWLRDYLYIPLGGNRHGTARTYANLAITMLLGGLWHGASWNFVLWGGLHGVGLAVHKWWSSGRTGGTTPGSIAARLATLFFVMVTWVPFRSQSFESTGIMLRKMFWIGDAGGGLWPAEWLLWCGIAVVAGHVVGVNVESMIRRGRRDNRIGRLLTWLGFEIESLPLAGPYVVPYRVTVGSVYITVTACLILFLFSPFATNPFIYFQF